MRVTNGVPLAHRSIWLGTSIVSTRLHPLMSAIIDNTWGGVWNVEDFDFASVLFYGRAGLSKFDALVVAFAVSVTAVIAT